MERLHRTLNSRAQQLRQTPMQMWSEMRPMNGVVPARGLEAGLIKLGLTLGAEDLSALTQALTGQSGGVGVVSLSQWQDFFRGALPAWEDSADERHRRLTLAKLARTVLQAVNGDLMGLLRWYAARDTVRNGKIPIDVFRAGLRAHGVIVSDADSLLAAQGMDPAGGGRTVEFAKLPAYMAGK